MNGHPCEKCKSVHTTFGYRRCVINIYPVSSASINRRKWWFRVTLPNGLEYTGPAVFGMGPAVDKAVEFIDGIR